MTIATISCQDRDCTWTCEGDLDDDVDIALVSGGLRDQILDHHISTKPLSSLNVGHRWYEVRFANGKRGEIEANSYGAFYRKSKGRGSDEDET